MPRKNPEAAREYCRQWRATNKEKTKAYSHKHRHERRERDRARMAVNPLIRHLGHVNGLAQECGRTGRITLAEFSELVAATHGICPGCERPFGEGGVRMTFDHIVPTSAGGEHSAANGQIICRTCNSSKGTGFAPRGWYKDCSPSAAHSSAAHPSEVHLQVHPAVIQQ